MEDEFLFGNLYKLDLHGLMREEALAEILHYLNLLDNNYDGVVLVHGYHYGRVLKNLVRKEISHPRIEKIVHINGGITAYKLKK